MDKRQQLLDLARRRQGTRWEGYRCVADYHDGAYEANWVSPYSKTAGNVDARVLILLQDWSSDDRLQGPLDPEAVRLGYTPRLPTNRNLTLLLKETFGLELQDVFGTNLFPFIKTGGLSSRIPTQDLERAAREFALPQIAIVRPVVVVCLGLATFNAIRRVYGMPTNGTLAEAIGSAFTVDGTRFWCQAHTGARGLANRGGLDCVRDDWHRMMEDVLGGGGEA